MLSLIVSSVLILGFQGKVQHPPTTKPSTIISDTATVMHRPGLFDLSVKDIDGKMVPLSKFRGKVIVMVNTASKSDEVKQYKKLQELYEANADAGLVVLAFPSNDFKNEPLTEAQIKKSVQKDYKATYPLFSKINVSGDAINQVYLVLTRRGPERKGIEGDFVKFIVDRKGKVVNRFPAEQDPNSGEMLSAIKSELAKKG